MHSPWNSMKAEINRRTFVKKGLSVAGVVTAGVGLLANGSSLLAEESTERSGRLSRGDAALLRFAAAAEILETDFWVQYNELCGIPDAEVPGGTGNPAFTAALSVLDADMAQYVHDNTDDEFTHQDFLNAYLKSKGAESVSLEPFRTLPGSTATGSSRKLRLTTHTRYQLVDALPKQYPQPGSRSKVHVPAGNPNSGSGQAYGYSKDRCRYRGSQLPPGDCKHRRLSLSHNRTRRKQPLPRDGAESQQRRGLANSNQHWSH
jgi:hypothetical protein